MVHTVTVQHMILNKLLQLSLMDSDEVSLPRNPAAVKGAAEPGRYTR